VAAAAAAAAAAAGGAGAGAGAGAPMIDAVVAVADPAAWHAANLRANAAHYSLAARCAAAAGGPAALAAAQAGGGALACGRVYYNAMLPVPAQAGRLWKYGVVAEAALADDCVHWRSLYLAGRLHKPVRVVAAAGPALRAALRENLRHALRAALLQLPAAFTAEALFARVVGLSYAGDFRMVFGENPHKVANIVAAQLPHFHALYAPVLAASFPTVALAGGGAAEAGAEADCEAHEADADADADAEAGADDACCRVGGVDAAACVNAADATDAAADSSAARRARLRRKPR